MTALRHTTLLATLALALGGALAACGDDEGGEAVDFELRVSPEFVQGMFSESSVDVLVEVVNASETDEAVDIEANITGDAVVNVDNSELAAGEIGTVTITAPAVAEPNEVELTLTITGTRDGVTQSATRTIVAMPGSDDREEQAREILAFFLEWLAEEHPDMGLDPDSELDGALVAPRLLVVSHYMFENAEYELGISWHVMVAPDDWAELYIRPVDEFAPTEAFRLSSWSTAIQGGDIEFTEVDPPAEVVR